MGIIGVLLVLVFVQMIDSVLLRKARFSVPGVILLPLLLIERSVKSRIDVIIYKPDRLLDNLDPEGSPEDGPSDPFQPNHDDCQYKTGQSRPDIGNPQTYE